MSQLEKLKDRFKKKPRDFSWDELERLLAVCGYEQVGPGKTGGSRQRFLHPNGSIISLHQPHPGNILKRYQIEQILEILTEEGLL